MPKTKKNEQLPGQISFFDDEPLAEIHVRAEKLAEDLRELYAKKRGEIDKLTLEEWSDADGQAQRELADSLFIAELKARDMVEYLRKATAIEFQAKIRKSL